MQEQQKTLNAIARQLGAVPELAASRISAIQAELGDARREIEDLQRKLARQSFNQMIESELESLNGVQALLAELDNTPMETMRQMTDWFRNRVSKGVMVLASDINGRPQIVVAVSDALVQDGMRAGDLIKPIARDCRRRWRRPPTNGASRRRRQQQNPASAGSRSPSSLKTAFGASRRQFQLCIIH